MVGSEAARAVRRWIWSHKAATALVVVLLTLVPVLPEYQMVDFAGRDEEAIKRLLCSKLPHGDCHWGETCSLAVEEQTKSRVVLQDKRALIPGIFHTRKKAFFFLFDYPRWKQAYARGYAAYQAIRRDVEKAVPVEPPRRSGVVRAACPSEPNWAEILKHVPLDELERGTQQFRDRIDKELVEELRRLDRIFEEVEKGREVK